MYVPAEREHVEVIGHSSPFLVIYVDRDEGNAELVALEENSFLMEAVPFESLRPFKQDPS